MPKTLRTIFCACLLAFLFCMAGNASDRAGSDGRLTILFTHDLHSYFLPERLPASAGPQATEGGYARLASLIEERRHAGPEKTLLVDAGDFSMGTLFHTAYMTDALELRLMGEMGYEATTLGNHDFDFRSDGLARMLNAARLKASRLPAMVASNVVFGAPGAADQSLRQAFADYPVREYTVIEKNGMKIGLFGLMGKDARSDAPFTAPVTFSDPITAGKRLTDILINKEKVDLVICLSHSGTWPDKSRSEDELLAKAVPQIDVIISGHTHTILPQPIIVGKTIIVSSGCYGKYLGVLDIVHSPAEGTKLVSYSLPPITDKIPENEKLARDIAAFKSVVDKNYLGAYGVTFDQKLAEMAFDMESLTEAYEHPGEMRLGNLITDAYRYAIEKAEGPRYDYVHAVVQPLGHIRSSLLAGKITPADLFRVLSLGLGTDGTPGYPLLAVYLTGREMRRLMEVETTIAAIKEDAHLQISGIKCIYNPHRIPFDRVTGLAIREQDGEYKAVEPDRLYRIAMNYYTAAMVDYVSGVSHGLLTIVPKDRQGRPIKDIKDAIIPAASAGTGPGQIKEWAALASYLRSFSDSDANGIPDIPDRYRLTEGRLIAQPSWDPVRLIAGGTWITYGAVAIFVLVLLAVIFLIRFFVRRIRQAKG
ncbi:MAG: bifunctional metallophosphatase/5'-nucleotidase [Deltaproteobacteria bacterium]|nr:bifunctional metallophosphatase/5'-nucleotidase [Deltaproteobacteria bacterium]